MLKKFLAAVTVLVCMFALAGCNVIKYNAEMNSFAKELVSAEFLNENRVKAFYLNENYVEGESLPSEKYIFDDKSPQSRTFLIKEKEEFNSIFSGYSNEIDFEKQMVLLHIFSDTNVRGYKLSKIDLNEKTLNVFYRLEQGYKKDNVMLYQRCLMVKLDKLEVETVNFIKN